MKKGFIHYYLMISCPSDVEDEVQTVKKTIEEINTDIGEQIGINFKTLDWKHNSRPDSGDAAQNIINEQLLNQADGIIAIFWTRFGTPTSQYGSGTEEEIQKAIEQGKSVKMYFSDKPINPSELNSRQYKRVTAFKRQYNGLSRSFKSSEDLKTMLRSHLLFLLSELKGKEIEAAQSDIDTKRRMQDQNLFLAALLNTYNESCEYRTSFRLADEKRINRSTESLMACVQELYYFQESHSLSAPDLSNKAADIVDAYNRYALDFNLFNDARKTCADNTDSLAKVAQDRFNDFVRMVIEAMNS